MKVLMPADAYRRRAFIGMLICLVLLGALSLAVVTGVTHSLDVSVRERFRPDFIWGVDQERASYVVFWLAPSRMVPALAAGAALLCAWRRTTRPLLLTALAVCQTGALTLALKLLLDRGDPTGQHTSIGGSFPSGHSAMLLVCVATGAMLVSRPTRWWQRAGFVLLEGLLAIAMLYVGLHWLTDIIGGAVVAGVALGVAALVTGPDRGDSHRRRGSHSSSETRRRGGGCIRSGRGGIIGRASAWTGWLLRQAATLGAERRVARIAVRNLWGLSCRK